MIMSNAVYVDVCTFSFKYDYTSFMSFLLANNIEYTEHITKTVCKYSTENDTLCMYAVVQTRVTLSKHFEWILSSVV